MTKALEDAIADARRLPEEAQNAIAETIEWTIAQHENPAPTLSDQQRSEVRRRLDSKRDVLTDAETAALIQRLT